MKMTLVRLLTISAVLLSACSKANIEIKDAYTPVRTEQQKMFAAYLDITNNTDASVELISVQSDSFKSVMLHQSSVDNGMATMRHLDKLIIKADETVKFEPNGKHIMLMGANENLWEKDNFILNLKFSDGSIIQQTILLKKPNK